MTTSAVLKTVFHFGSWDNLPTDLKTSVACITIATEGPTAPDPYCSFRELCVKKTHPFARRYQLFTEH